MPKVRALLILCVCVVALVATPRAQSNNPVPCAPSIGYCPITGCSSNPSAAAPVDKELNTRKNRGPADMPSAHLGTYSVGQVMEDQNTFPIHRPARGNFKDVRSAWDENDSASQDVRSTEDHLAAVVGYILRAKPGGAESCNCDITSPDAIDTHVNLVVDANSDADPSALLGQSMIAEITHRMRDPAWTVGRLNTIALASTNGNPKPRVRIIGTLTYDNLHWDMINKRYRGTLWEVHPIERIDVEINGKFVPFSGAPSLHSDYLTIKRLLLVPQPPPNTLTPQAVTGPRFTNARVVHWTPQQIQALDHLMGADTN